MKCIFTFIVCFFSSLLVAQNITVQGRLLGAKNENLIAATIRCYLLDTLFVKGTTTNAKGVFELKQLSQGKRYLLRFNYLGYKEVAIILNPTSENLIRLGDIVMSNKDQQLQEVTVIGKIRYRRKIN